MGLHRNIEYFQDGFQRDLIVRICFDLDSAVPLLVTPQDYDLYEYYGVEEGVEENAFFDSALDRAKILGVFSEKTYTGAYVISNNKKQVDSYIKQEKERLKTERVSRSGYVYVIHCTGTPFYKIGETGDLDARLATHQTSNPFELEYSYTIKVVNPKGLESKLHNTFKNSLQNGEWFTLRKEDFATIETVTQQWIDEWGNNG